MKGEFFAVGIGAGDPDLMTIKAIKTILASDVIALPNSGASDNIAQKIAGEYIKDKTVIYCDMPMTKDENILSSAHNKCADEIATLLDGGRVVSFLTLGDPTIYSTVMYVHKILTRRGYCTHIVSGIPSFCAAAASLNQSLCERDEMLHIIPATYTDMEEILKLDGNKVLMKSGKSIIDIKEKLKDKNAMLVECATMENEKLYFDLQKLEKVSSYFSIVVVK